MAMPIDLPTYATLPAMITPALFMTACGSLIISTSNRMGRIVDRIRVQNEANDQLGRDPGALDFVAERRAHLDDQLDRLVRRSGDVRRALMMLYLALGAFVGTSLALAFDVWAGNRIRAVPTALAVVGVVLMLVACVHLVREALAALRSNHLEVCFYRDLQVRRSGAGPSSCP
jgi:Protein of unknown function (DUF2721)